jgi:hypothetical protein
MGSLKKKMPTSTVPTAPTPVQTTYAVPRGKFCVAFINKVMLIISVTKKPAYHHIASVPLVSFAFPKQNAKATSNKPAMIKMIQFMFLFFCKDLQPKLNFTDLRSF